MVRNLLSLLYCILLGMVKQKNPCKLPGFYMMFGDWIPDPAQGGQESPE